MKSSANNGVIELMAQHSAQLPGHLSDSREIDQVRKDSTF